MAHRISRRAALTIGLGAAGALTVAVPAAQASPASAPTPRGGAREDIAYIDVAVATLWVEPDIARELDAPSLANPVDPRAWTSGMSLADRRWLVGQLETQALYGQAVTILETSGDWAHVAVGSQPTPRHELGYPGWLPTSQLTADAPGGDARLAIVKTATTWLHDKPELGSEFMEISYSTRLPVLDETDGAVQVAAGSHGEKWLVAADVDLHDSPESIPPPTAEDLVGDARMFLELPYLWAGVSGFGFDCSGFTLALYAAYGRTIARDADAQLAEGAPVEEPDAGDLLFYGTDRIHHVGMHIGDGQMIDARTNTDTEEQTIEIVPVEEHPYAHQYAGAVRYLGQ